MSADSQTIITPSDYSKGSESTSSVPCGICRRQFSRYTCPKCNLLYCSLQCFRSPTKTHADCSEAFYRKEVETDIHTTPSKTAEERQKMMELLKRFEEDALNDDQAPLGDSDSDEEDDDLASKLESMDLENASHEEIWSALSPAQQDKFLKALNDPSSDLAQQLLTSEELEKQIEEPWWERPSDLSGLASDAHQRGTKGARYGVRPEITSIPHAALNASAGAASMGPSLLYNIFATLVTYAYVTRYLSTSPLASISPGDPEHYEARQFFSRLVPFLTDRKSRTVLPSLSGLITHLWSRFEPGSMTPALFALLMRDVAKLMRPSTVVPIASSGPTESFADHPSANALCAISDLSALFQRSSASSVPSAVSAKLAFYAARIVSTPAYILIALADEAMARARLVEREEDLDKIPASEAVTEQTREAKPQIEELT
ncbi:uncharacterized protein PHACADRAFT_32993 [Phanerochaete carnosa HHB-10118-sp]|uniref:HIT-type domain-containing protein n=1 Tax=Phanerochaete carnosa (strain HHB-10118-sp) TaxID=650164 RepID=K5VTP5_PHACS|nr:uncharacterized protein PHACADRAFT_32993 [Phanerochaete carnosa HHB-10118-sp]EKM50170.1 hypothetical protein PHACADRAFT_32993 [Phanerochaete carnosa HHB-10118-sp]